jgi:hypothetical protein
MIHHDPRTDFIDGSLNEPSFTETTPDSDRSFSAEPFIHIPILLFV